MASFAKHLPLVLCLLQHINPQISVTSCYCKGNAAEWCCRYRDALSRWELCCFADWHGILGPCDDSQDIFLLQRMEALHLFCTISKSSTNLLSSRCRDLLVCTYALPHPLKRLWHSLLRRQLLRITGFLQLYSTAVLSVLCDLRDPDRAPEQPFWDFSEQRIVNKMPVCGHLQQRASDLHFFHMALGMIFCKNDSHKFHNFTHKSHSDMLQLLRACFQSRVNCPVASAFIQLTHTFTHKRSLSSGKGCLKRLDLALGLELWWWQSTLLTVRKISAELNGLQVC